VKAGSCSNEARLYFYLCYSEYLCTIGNIDKSIAIFDICGQLVESDTQLLVFDKSDKVESVPIILQIAQAFYVKSKIDYSVGNISTSCLDVLECLRLLAKAAKYLSDVSVEVGSKVSSSLDACNLPKSISIYSFRLVQVLSHLIKPKSLLKIYDWLGQVYAFQGTPVESEHYFRQGLEIAESNYAEIFISKFNVALSDVECRRYHLEKSQELFARVKLDEEMAPRDTAVFDACKGQIFSSGREYEKSVGEYMSAVDILEKAMDREYVREIDVKSIVSVPVVEVKKVTGGKRIGRGTAGKAGKVSKVGAKTKEVVESQGVLIVNTYC
jgi:tetratricopeptide (TPR) repeat protein